MLKATVSGSFHRHMVAIYNAVSELISRGVIVLSPADPRVIDEIGDFLFVASDWSRSVRLVQDRHLECIQSSDFLLLVAPDGYVGQSASMEIGHANAYDVPIFCLMPPSDLTLQQYVQQIPDICGAIAAADAMARTRRRADAFLVDPSAALGVAERRLERMRETLRRAPSLIRDDAVTGLYNDKNALAPLLSLPERRRP